MQDEARMKQIEKAIIIGAGPAGITAALRLQQKNRIPCVIYEVREAPSTLGGAIGIPSNGLRLLSRLDLYDKVLAKGVETLDLVVRSHAGKLMGKMHMVSWSKKQTGFGYVRIRRTALMDVLFTAAEQAAIPIHFNKQLTRIEEKDELITAYFSDGTSDTASFLIGADGIHSSVRKLYVDPQCSPKYSGISNVFSLLPRSELFRTVPSIEGLNATLTSDGMFGVSPATNDGDIIYWFFSRELKISASADSHDGWEETRKKEVETVKATILSLLGEEQSEWSGFLRNLVERTEVFKFYPVHKLPLGRPWHKGRCLIIGDAAHAMPPHASQGVSMALEDVFLFSNLLHSGRHNIEDMLNIYDSKRRVRTETMLQIAERNGEVRKQKGPWKLWANEIIVSAGLWSYKTMGLERLGLGQRPLAYDVEEEI